MTERELWLVIWRALRMAEIAIAKYWKFGEFKEAESLDLQNSV